MASVSTFSGDKWVFASLKSIERAYSPLDVLRHNAQAQKLFSQKAQNKFFKISFPLLYSTRA